MAQLKNLSINCNTENEGGIEAELYVIKACDLETFAQRFKDDATEFSTSVGYALEDLVNYEGETYECTTIHAAGAWNASNFTLIENGNVRINGVHVPKAGKSFVKLQLATDDDQLTVESLGKRFSRGARSLVEAFHPGSTVDAASFADYVKNGAVLGIAKLNGKLIQISLPGRPAECVASYQSGTKANPDSRWKFDFSANHGMCYYEGPVPTVS
jgi:hypothetical protein